MAHLGCQGWCPSGKPSHTSLLAERHTALWCLSKPAKIDSIILQVVLNEHLALCKEWLCSSVNDHRSPSLYFEVESRALCYRDCGSEVAWSWFEIGLRNVFLSFQSSEASLYSFCIVADEFLPKHITHKVEWCCSRCLEIAILTSMVQIEKECRSLRASESDNRRRARSQQSTPSFQISKRGVREVFNVGRWPLPWPWIVILYTRHRGFKIARWMRLTRTW